MANYQLNDPDFDQPTSSTGNTNQQSLMGSLPPKTLFIGGMVVGVMVLCTIGFFILLSLWLKAGH